MSLGFLILAAAFDGYLVWLAVASRREIARCGAPMMIGVAAAFTAVGLGEGAILMRQDRFADWMGVAALAAIGFMGYAVWRHRKQWFEPRAPDRE